MKKELISKDTLDKFISGYDGRLYVGQNRLLTPGAKDEAKRRRIQIIYAEEPAMAPATPKTESKPLLNEEVLTKIVVSLATLLREQYGINDEKKLEKTVTDILSLVVKKI